MDCQLSNGSNSCFIWDKNIYYLGECVQEREIGTKTLQKALAAKPLFLEGIVRMDRGKNELTFNQEIPCKAINEISPAFLHALADVLNHVAVSENGDFKSKYTKDGIPVWSSEVLKDIRYTTPTVSQIPSAAFYDPIEPGSHFHCYESDTVNTWVVFSLEVSTPAYSDEREDLADKYYRSLEKSYKVKDRYTRKAGSKRKGRVFKIRKKAEIETEGKVFKIQARILLLSIPQSGEQLLSKNVFELGLIVNHLVSGMATLLNSSFDGDAFFLDSIKYLSKQGATWDDFKKAWSIEAILERLKRFLSEKDRASFENIMDEFTRAYKTSKPEKYVEVIDGIPFPMRSSKAIRCKIKSAPFARSVGFRHDNLCYFCGEVFNPIRRTAQTCSENCRKYRTRVKELIFSLIKLGIKPTWENGTPEITDADIKRRPGDFPFKIKNKNGGDAALYEHFKTYLKTQKELGFPDPEFPEEWKP